jgi:phosphopantothenoylcysteine decarboxylase/phosphopantothenate--cysteine ligase
MWEHESTKHNLKKLVSYGYKLIGPEIGEMACGEYGEGKMSEPYKISKEINNYFLNLKKNKKLKALVTAEMLMETQKNLPADVAVFSAAVADFKVNKKYKNKIKKQDSLNLNLEKNVDILSYVSNHNSMRPELVIGFAAETDNVENNAEKKLNNKNCDWIVANDVSDKKIGFSSDFNEVTIYYRDKNKEKLSYKKKSEISDEIVDRIINQLN